MSEVTRRGFFAASAGAVVGGPAAAQAAAERAGDVLGRTMLSKGASTLRGGYDELGAAKQVPEGWTLLNKARDKWRTEAQRRVQWRVNGLDPDIGALRLPRPTLVRMQEARDQELLTVFEKIQKQLDEFKW